MKNSISKAIFLVTLLIFLLVITSVILMVLILVDFNKVLPGTTIATTSPVTTSQPYGPVCYYNMKNPAWTTTYRLSNSTVPILYTLTVQPFIGSGLFNGTVSIKLSVSKPTCFVYLHQNGLNVTTASLRDAMGNSMPILQSFSYPQYQYWVVALKNTLNPGNYVLSLTFQGSLTKNIVGFYRSVYTNKLTGKQSQLATTKFEPTYARKAFPCFDEPNKKANFSIIIVSDPKHKTVISNMPIQSSKSRADGWTVTTFQTSPKMSTYLVVFIVSDFVSMSQKSNGGVMVKTYAPSDRINSTSFALNTATKCLDFYDNYFGIPYNQSIAKLDLVSIPDFISGAMENWGAVTFRETNILFDPLSASAHAQERVVEVVAHELAHMWFGNLVTMNWWDDLWLNEGFATFMAYVKAIAAIHPDWNSDSTFVFYELQDVLPLDSVAASHSIIQPVYTPDDINSAFDSITYGKGSSVLRMLDGYMSSDVFQKGIKAYLTKFQYQNAKTDDLWSVLQQTSGQNVKTIMDKWTKQMGYPVVTWNATSGSVMQRRFYSNPKNYINNTAQPLMWYIPLTYETANGHQNSTLFNPQMSQNMGLHSNQIGKWIKFNTKEKGYYRVNYDSATWQALINQLSTAPQVFSGSDRSELIDDSFNLAGAGLLDYATPLKMLQYLKGENRWVPWDSATSNLEYIDVMLRQSNQSGYALFSRYIVNISSPVLVNLGWNDSNDTNNRKRLRNLVIGLSCSHGNQHCISNATTIFSSWLKNQSLWISPNYRKSVFKYGMQTLGNTPTVWNQVWNRYLVSTPDTTRDFQYALAQTTNSSLLQQYLTLAENKSYVRDQDYFMVMSYISANPKGTMMVYNYVKNNWNKLVARFSLNGRYFGRFLATMTRSFNTQQLLTNVQAFFAQHPNAGAGAGPRKEAIANIQKNIAWTKANVPKIVSWLQNNVSL